MELMSPEFGNNEPMPEKYTCDGKNISPPLIISELPEGTQSLVLIMDDPDAPNGDFVHWLLFNIPPSTTQIAENSIPKGAIEGTTSFGKTGYGGPCPPSDIHRYQFKIYTLNKVLNLNQNTIKKDVLAAIEGSVLDQDMLVGLYQRSQ